MSAVALGGAGFIGSHVVDDLVAKGDQVAAVDDLSTGHLKNVSSDATIYRLDIRSQEWPVLFSKLKPDIVFHLQLRQACPTP